MSRLVLAVVVVGTLTALPGLAGAQSIENPSFEKVDEREMPEGWGVAAWGADALDPQTIVSAPEQSGAPDGVRAGQLTTTRRHFATMVQALEGLVPGQWYELSAMVKCEQLDGHGCFVAVEYWKKDASDGSEGCINSPNLIGTRDWERVTVRFLAPGNDYRCLVCCWNAGGIGKACFDDVAIRPIPRPAFDTSARRVLDAPYWGMFTCFANYLHQYGADMKSAGVHWQRMGTAALNPDQTTLARNLGMEFAMCLDGMPAPGQKDDPCYPVTSTPAYQQWLDQCVQGADPTIRIWEVFNEPNTNPEWGVQGYTNLLKVVGERIHAKRPGDWVATGGFCAYIAGYVAAVLREGAAPSLDMVMMHPYAVDEALDTLLYSVGDACATYGRPDMALAINETGWPTYDPATGLEDHNWFVSEAEQASNLVKLHVQGLAHKLSFVCWLGWNDLQQSDQARNMGLVRIDGSKKPAYHAYTFMIQTIGTRRLVDWSYGDKGTRVYRIGQDKPVWVVWNALGDADTVVDVGASKVFVCDIYGTKLTVRPQTGNVTLQAMYEPRYLVPVE